MDFDKTFRDSCRGIYDLGYSYCGCEPLFFPKEYSTDPEAVFRQMVLINTVFHAQSYDIAQHRIITFHPAELVLPSDLNELGKRIIWFYKEAGYMSCYGVHRDTAHQHIHVAVNSASYINGKRFSISNEIIRLNALVNSWYTEHMAGFYNDPCKQAKYESLLFGDEQPRYGQSAIFAKSQIKKIKQISMGL